MNERELDQIYQYIKHRLIEDRQEAQRKKQELEERLEAEFWFYEGMG